MSVPSDNFRISTDKQELDVHLIYSFLTESYRAKGRSMKQVQKSISNSLCFGLYNNTSQIGFARVVTDYTLFACLMDVFIIEAYRKRGLAKMLMRSILQHPDLIRVSKWLLATEDAHGFYHKFGFRQPEKPEIFLQRVTPPVTDIIKPDVNVG